MFFSLFLVSAYSLWIYNEYMMSFIWCKKKYLRKIRFDHPETSKYALILQSFYLNMTFTIVKSPTQSVQSTCTDKIKTICTLYLLSTTI